MLWQTFFFFNDTATTEIYTLSLHDALPISPQTAFRLRSPGDRPRDAHTAHAANGLGSGCSTYCPGLSHRTENHGATPFSREDKNPQWWHSVRNPARA